MKVFTVSALTALIRTTLAANPELNEVVVEGEISNLTTPASGHLYFTLKDRNAAIGCVCFRSAALRIPFRPEAGMVVTASGRIDLYEQQGRYQLHVEKLEPTGIGALAVAVEQRKRALAAEGLFDEGRKRPLPKFPRRVVVVTSRSAAALRDVVTVMRRRAPAVDVILSPATVQGEGAAETLITALRRAADVRGAEVILLVRGGGSLEDLMAFNDGALARAIAVSPLPVVCGVGHETDVTIADLVADRRAPTPSAAAELVVPDCLELKQAISEQRFRLANAAQRAARLRREKLNAEERRLSYVSPSRWIASRRQELDHRTAVLRAGLLAQVNRRQRILHASRQALNQQLPVRRLARQRERLQLRNHRLSQLAGKEIAIRQGRLRPLRASLEALSPLRVLQRGYSITRDSAGKTIKSADALRSGDLLRTVLADGQVESRVT